LGGAHEGEAMGYDVHITRKNDWSDPEGPEISLAEWLAVVEADPEMRLDGYAESRLDNGEVFRTEKPGLSVWTAYSQHAQGGNMAWFLYSRGEVIVKNPDEEILGKMWSIGQALSAKVQGDDGEVYDSSGLATHPDADLPGKPWWRFW
jgi:hypothetical protein